MLNSSVLVLNRLYQPIHVTNVRRAFTLMYQGVARAVDSEYRLFDFESWSQLSSALHDSIGGVTSWENVVCSCIACNLRKGGRTPEEARMPLFKRPVRPRWTPFFRTPSGRKTYREWIPFLNLADASYWNAELSEE